MTLYITAAVRSYHVVVPQLIIIWVENRISTATIVAVSVNLQ